MIIVATLTKNVSVMTYVWPGLGMGTVGRGIGLSARMQRL